MGLGLNGQVLDFLKLSKMPTRFVIQCYPIAIIKYTNSALFYILGFIYVESSNNFVANLIFFIFCNRKIVANFKF